MRGGQSRRAPTPGRADPRSRFRSVRRPAWRGGAPSAGSGGTPRVPPLEPTSGDDRRRSGSGGGGGAVTGSAASTASSTSLPISTRRQSIRSSRRSTRRPVARRAWGDWDPDRWPGYAASVQGVPHLRLRAPRERRRARGSHRRLPVDCGHSAVARPRPGRDLREFGRGLRLGAGVTRLP